MKGILKCCRVRPKFSLFFEDILLTIFFIELTKIKKLIGDSYDE